MISEQKEDELLIKKESRDLSPNLVFFVVFRNSLLSEALLELALCSAWGGDVLCRDLQGR